MPLPSLSRLLVPILLLAVNVAQASPAQEAWEVKPNRGSSRFYDIQAHRGGRGNTVESTLPSFAWGLIDGSTTLELDNGITKDGHVVVWHDESVVAQKCRDTRPAFPHDPDFPYVGKFIANLTLAQIRTLDCGSLRQSAFPMQVTYPGARISTMQEVFGFVECADPTHQIQWNIESKINAAQPNCTRSVDDFVTRQHAIFAGSPYRHSITYQSFDWRTLVAMKELDRNILTSALIDEDNAFTVDGSPSPWLAGRRIDAFPGETIGQRIAQAAHDISADVLSPASTYSDLDGSMQASEYASFVTKDMVEEAHRLNLSVKPWTANTLDVVERIAALNVDGIITDYPNVVRRWAKVEGYTVAPKYPKQRVFRCLEEHMRLQ
ncbi:PLC-like phosphodiesterase [Punctularia strigosozonata HHB-11173 SS5]|uniref:PLC-like phosphodiesterase n=1 Tax=Punctularia strigosozonata (strain HHB-11173) TaxID=741275 RepID=UPI0004417EE3|nr:PLC-like phosphodiesterase [Punctularia strigosozonata HHB-11173 SS5]EIN13659.1 PLC-like phosphodiesterase [Punctularia strigosozonata HHB-11173 SS5]